MKERPLLRRDFIAMQAFDSDILFSDSPSFAADVLAMPGGQCGEKIFEVRIVPIVPVKLATMAY